MMPSTDFRFGGFNCISELTRGAAQIGRKFIERFRAAPTGFMRSPIERITKIDKDDFGEVRIETTKLIEGLLKILLLDGGRNRIRRCDNRCRAKRDTLFRGLGKPVNHHAR